MRDELDATRQGFQRRGAVSLSVTHKETRHERRARCNQGKDSKGEGLYPLSVTHNYPKLFARECKFATRNTIHHSRMSVDLRLHIHFIVYLAQFCKLASATCICWPALLISQSTLFSFSCCTIPYIS